MGYLTPQTPVKWTDLAYFSWAPTSIADSASLGDSAYNFKNPQIVEVRINTNAFPVYGGATMGPSQVLEGQHVFEIDFQAQITGLRPFYTILAADTTYAGQNIQESFFTEIEFSDCKSDSASATRWEKWRFKGCRMRDLRARAQHGGDFVMSGTILAQDVKFRGVPDTT